MNSERVLLNNTESVMKEFEFSIFIGRFQPIHKAHLELVKTALAKNGKNINEFTLISPDAGALKKIYNLAEKLKYKKPLTQFRF